MPHYIKQRSIRLTEGKNMNDLRGDGSLINSWVPEMCCVANTSKGVSIPLFLLLLCVTDKDLCVCVCAHTNISSYYLSLSLSSSHTKTYTGYTVNLSSDRSNLNCCISLVVPQPPALPSVTGWQLHKYSLLWWCMRHKSVWMWQLLFVSPSFFSPCGEALSPHIFLDFSFYFLLLIVSSPLFNLSPFLFFTSALEVIHFRFIQSTFAFVRVLAELLFLTWGWQLACDGLAHRANSMKWNEPARCQVPRIVREPTGIHVEQCCTSPGPSSQAMLCNPSLNYLSQCIDRAVERLELPLHLLFFTTLLFFYTVSLLSLKLIWLPLPT